MKATLVLLATLAVLASAAYQPIQRIAVQRNGDLIPGHYNFVFRKDIDVENARAFAKSVGARLFSSFGDFKFFTAEMKEETLLRLSERFDLFEAIEQDQIVYTFDGVHNKTAALLEQVASQYGATWGLDRIDQRALPLNQIYNYKDSAGSGTVVYVIDTGVLFTHTEFSGRAYSGPNFHTGTDDSTDDNGHGTHCAGTIGGRTYGVAKNAQIVGIKTLGRLGSGSLANVAAGVNWAASDSRGKRAVASMSLGGSASTVLDSAVTAAINAGLPVIAASGNSNADACTFSPARVATLSVNAADNTDTRASFSNYGTCTDIFAPGVSITSAWIGSNSATNTISGTSMACPHVAGAAAVLLADAVYTPAALAQAIINNAIPNIVKNPGTGSPNRLLYSPY